MAKQQGPLRLSGKLGDKVYSTSKNGKAHVQLSPGYRPVNAVLKKQNSFNILINTLASNINTAVHSFAGSFKNSSFYHSLLSSLRSTLHTEPLVLLHQLTGMEVHPKYPFSQICPLPPITVNASKGHLTVTLTINHPPHPKKKAEHYFFEIGLIVWNKADSNCVYEKQLSEWLPIQTALPVSFSFPFKRPAHASSYLVTCRCVLGNNETDSGDFPMQGMYIAHTGSLDKKANEVLADVLAEAKAAANATVKKVVPVEVKRVKRD